MRDHAATWDRVMVPNYGTPSIQIVSGEGAHVTDAEGNRYLDLLAGLAVNILGHAHPAVVAAVRRQVATLGHVSNLYASPQALELAQRLHTLANGKKALLVNSGSEANEVAYKAVRRHAHAGGYGDDAVVLAFEGAFHGRTTAALALTGTPAYHRGFTPFPPGIVHVPYNDPAALEDAFDEYLVAGVFAEYVQGEGGVVPATQEFADAISRLCSDHGAVLVADEVQTGLGRTGALFAHDHYGARPDIVTMAKGLGGGLPVGACLMTDELADHFGPGSHGCTFGGNPVACAAANAVLDAYAREGLEARAARLGAVLAKHLDDALARHDLAVRGLGLLLGVPLPAPVAGDAVRGAAGRGVLVGQAGKNVVRLAPPLIVDEDDLVEAVPAVVAAVEGALGIE